MYNAGAYQLTTNELVKSRALSRAFLVSVFVVLMSLGAYVRIPLYFTPVPITLQTLFVFLSGAMLGRRLGCLAQSLYIGLGALGLPVFQGYGSGVGHIFGPTGGYLAGFVAASYIIGAMLEKRPERSLIATVLAMISGMFIYFLLGAAWLVILGIFDIRGAIFAGVVPFLPGDMAKISFASLIYMKLHKRIKAVLRD